MSVHEGQRLGALATEETAAENGWQLVVDTRTWAQGNVRAAPLPFSLFTVSLFTEHVVAPAPRRNCLSRLRASDILLVRLPVPTSAYSLFVYPLLVYPSAPSYSGIFRATP